MKTNRPILSTEQIRTLKSDINQLSRLIARSVKGVPFKVTTTQNAFAKRMGFTSFSELKLVSSDTNNIGRDFTLIDEIHYVDLQHVYGKSLTPHFFDAVETIKAQHQDRIEVSKNNLSGIALNDFLDAYNAGTINGGTVKDSLPSYGKLSANENIFSSYDEGDTFDIVFENKVVTFTVTEKGTMMDTGMPIVTFEQGIIVSTPSGRFKVA